MYFVQGNEKDEWKSAMSSQIEVVEKCKQSGKDEEYIVVDPISKKQFKSLCKIEGTNYMVINLETNMTRKIIEVEDNKLLPKHPGAKYNI